MNNNDSLKFTGKYKFTLCSIENESQRTLLEKIRKIKENGGFFDKELRLLHAMSKTRVYEYDNLIPTVGRTLIADNLTNASPDNDPRINYVALGSNATAPANGDTTLGTEVYRNAIASQTNASNVAYFTGFFDATETTGTYAEAGIFADGTASADSGILFSHVAISITKSASETLTIDWTVTLT